MHKTSIAALGENDFRQGFVSSQAVQARRLPTVRDRAPLVGARDLHCRVFQLVTWATQLGVFLVYLERPVGGGSCSIDVIGPIVLGPGGDPQSKRLLHV